MNKVVFLDRDGVINREMGDYVYQWTDFHFTSGIFPALRLLQAYDYQFIVITNQGGIAKGLYTAQDVDRLHQQMLARLKEEGIRITAVYYCPHHDTISPCLCRKPQGLMLEKAIAKYGIIPSESFMIGDKESDVAAAESVGVKGILIKANENILPRVKMDILNVV